VRRVKRGIVMNLGRGGTEGAKISVDHLRTPRGKENRGCGKSFGGAKR